ncbi:MAG: AbrB/MazE/SpoVT family DNA-binding domain-containing protein [Candidatus Portnoybacteria bacterium]|nr:AbrB/MazE/SpoVT family DNA-binding domain-containing protein [Candidatus Portnoybacteria bacterium]
MTKTIFKTLKSSYMPVVKVKQSNQLTLPREFVSRLDIKEGDYLDVELKGGTIVLKKKIAKKEDEEWFFSPEWQKKEREADRAIAEGRVSQVFDTAKAAIKTLRSKTL